MPSEFLGDIYECKMYEIKKMFISRRKVFDVFHRDFFLCGNVDLKR